METIFSLTEAKSKFSDIINRIIYRREKITITKKGKEVAVILPIAEFRKFEKKGLIEAKGVLAGIDDTVEEMVVQIYAARESEESREVKL
jgi:prevent-host-death family protein